MNLISMFKILKTDNFQFWFPIRIYLPISVTFLIRKRFQGRALPFLHGGALNFVTSSILNFFLQFREGKGKGGCMKIRNIILKVLY